MNDLEALAAANRERNGMREPAAPGQFVPPNPIGTERIWTVHDRGQQFGPHTEQEIASFLAVGTISETALCWRVGSTRWIPVSNIIPLPPRQSSMPPQPHYGPPPIQIINHIVNQTGPAANRLPRWSPGVAALLSFLLPGAGQMYKGQVFNGIAWFLFVLVGYCCFVLPGLILHLCCIGGAAAGDPYR